MTPQTFASFLSFLLVHLQPSSQLSQHCFNVFRNLSHPLDCCRYPIADTLRTTADHCYHSCFLDPGICCLYDCMQREMKYFDNGKFTVEDRVSYYDVDLDNKKIPKHLWLPVVEKSVETCERIGEKFVGMKKIEI
jgi:hypothetical protein